MQTSNVKVLYIDGQGRSGSTLLHNVLGQFEGFFAAGELREIWRRLSNNDRPCGCGAPINECEVWRGVLNEAFGDLSQVDAEKMERLRNRARNRHSPLLLLPQPQRERLLRHRLQDYVTNLEKLYRGIRDSTGSKVIVDSSKSLLYGYLLGMLPTIDLYVVHIVRDPRGVAHSLRQRKLRGIPQFADWNPVKGSLVWNNVNLTREVFWRRFGYPYLRMRYEDFISRPQEAVGQILDLVDEKAIHSPFAGEREIEMNFTHNVGGNENARFRTGKLDLKPDERWKKELSFTDKALTTTFTWPLLLRYGYHKQHKA